MPTIDTKTQHMTVRRSPDTPGCLEVTVHHRGEGHPTQLLTVSACGPVMSRRELKNSPIIEAVQLRLDRNDAMLLLDLLQQVAYELPLMPDDQVVTVGAYVPPPSAPDGIIGVHWEDETQGNGVPIRQRDAE